MPLNNDPQDDLDFLLTFVPEPLREEVTAHVDWMVRNDQWWGIDWCMLGFLNDYACLAQYIKNHSYDGHRLTVYDVGCSTALQHLMFSGIVEYVGIDSSIAPEPKFFLPNCRFIRGRFSKVVDSLNIDPETSFGIANMSISCNLNPEELQAFDRVFKRKAVM